jgi:hypothetical protein
MTSSPIFLMTDPRHFKLVYQINPWMRSDAWSTRSSAALESAIDQAGTVA